MASKFSMTSELIPLRLNELLDLAVYFNHTSYLNTLREIKNTTINTTGSDSSNMLINLWLMPPAHAPIPLALLPDVDITSAIKKAAIAITIVTRRDTKKDFNVFDM
jgi:hypothetical protein